MAGISVSVVAGLTADTSSVSVTGSVQHIITDTEVASFGIKDAQLKSAIATYFGQAPDDAFLHSVTPWNDLYSTYGWPQVQTTLNVVSATITGIATNPTIIATQTFTNNSSVTGTFNVGISQNVTNTSETNWTTTNTIEVSQSISYDVSFLGSGGGGETSFSYSYAWGQGGSQSDSVTVGSSQGVAVVLDPGQSVNAQLTATKGTLSVAIVYEASLSGSTAINYGGTFKDHHFWGLDLPSVMAVANIANSLRFTETITVGFYSNSVVSLTNPDGSPAKTLGAVAATASRLTAK